MSFLALDPKRPYQELDLGDASAELREAAEACFEVARRAGRPRKETFQPVDDSTVEVAILERHLAGNVDVFGLASDAELSNAIGFNSRHVAASIRDGEMRRVRRSFDDVLRREVARAFAPARAPLLFWAADYWYPAGAYMGWHTNNRFPGWRIYVTHASEPGRSFFRYRDPLSGEVRTSLDARWMLRFFLVDPKRPLWHAIYADAERFSFGYMAHPRSPTALLKRRVRDVLERVY